jgi:phosphoglycerate dehydrogenase-like enzyme
MKPSAIFYNIGRGATVNQDALLEALRSKRLGAAWLDITEPEPFPDDYPLWKEPNCFITPHVAGGHLSESNARVRHSHKPAPDCSRRAAPRSSHVNSVVTSVSSSDFTPRTYAIR